MEPKNNCNLCSRLVDLRNKNKILFPKFFNDWVLGIEPLYSKLLIIGLAPGLRGANRTGEIFNGDFSGNLLFNFLKKIILQKIMMNLIKSAIYDAELLMQLNACRQITNPQVMKLKRAILF